MNGLPLVKSRCVSKKPTQYLWFGEAITRMPGESEAKSVALAVGGKISNELLSQGEITSSMFNFFKMKISSLIEMKLNRAQLGRLSPGSEVVRVELAWGKDLPMYEIKFTSSGARFRETGGNLQIRHYECEPAEKEKMVAGLKFHRKRLDTTDSEARALQNEQMNEAISIAEECASRGWISAHRD